jgi:hypothetical protein
MMSKIFVLFLGVAAAELTFTGYSEGSLYHKAVTVSNTGCADINIADYSIQMYMNKNTNKNYPCDFFDMGATYKSYPTDTGSITRSVIKVVHGEQPA